MKTHETAMAFLVAAFVGLGAAAETFTLASPDGRLVATVSFEDGIFAASLAYDGQPVLRPAPFGQFVLAGEKAPVPYALDKSARASASVNTAWMNPFGERSKVIDRHNDLTLGVVRSGRPAALEFRAYDAGFAYRFVWGGAGSFVVASEADSFVFGGDYRCWPVYHAQGEYKPARLSELAAGLAAQEKNRTGIERPFVVEGPGFVAALGEAANIRYARTKFQAGARPFSVVTCIDSPATVACPSAMPWRYVRVARDVCALYAGNDLPLNLNEPSKIADRSWIRPGKVLRVARLDEATGRAAVDFAKKTGFSYIELDAGWYGPEATCNPLEPKPFVKPVLAYAKERGVPVLLYVNRKPLKANIDEILRTLKGWGVAGIKYGFVDVGAQKWQAWVSDAIAKAADHQLMLDIHDEYRLTGNERTWPNVMTVEGIRGNEEMPDAAHDCALAFTRYLGGPGDYTPCWTVPRVKNSLAHQLALPAVCFSPFQFLFWYQRPEQVDVSNPALAFWSKIPTVWDESCALQGKIGEYAVMARRSGKDWYVGGLNAIARRTFRVPLAFLGAGAYRAEIYRDADPAATNMNQVACESRQVTAGDTVELEAASNGGFALRLVPVVR